jgi:hypothetical protein
MARKLLLKSLIEIFTWAVPAIPGSMAAGFFPATLAPLLALAATSSAAAAVPLTASLVMIPCFVMTLCIAVPRYGLGMKSPTVVQVEPLSE